MKTWTNPTVEELDVKLTANGKWDFYFETVEEFEQWLLQNPDHKNDFPDIDWVNNELTKDKTQS